MKVVLLFILCGFWAVAFGEVISVPSSVSPDGKIYAVVDIDRDSNISPEWKGDSYPQIEITEKATGKVLASISYFGAMGDEARPLREKVKVFWRSDSKALGITIDDRFYSFCSVYALSKEGKFVAVPLPQKSYEEMTGFPSPDVEKLRPRGRREVVGWDENGLLIYSIFLVPLSTFEGNDPLNHKVYLKVRETQMSVVKVEQEKGFWRRGDWISEEDE